MVAGFAEMIEREETLIARLDLNRKSALIPLELLILQSAKLAKEATVS
jgi:hypothetical protein